MQPIVVVRKAQQLGGEERITLGRIGDPARQPFGLRATERLGQRGSFLRRKRRQDDSLQPALTRQRLKLPRLF